MTNPTTTQPRESLNRGKWSEPGIPHKGWSCVSVCDNDTVYQTCQMCETAEIRYVHVMRHPDYPTALEVGVVCASNMETDLVAPKERESRLRSRADRRKVWLDRNWKPSKRGNPYLNTRQHNVVLFQAGNTWSWRVRYRLTNTVLHAGHGHPSSDSAALAAFDFLNPSRIKL